jgi:DNA-binding beta-propeller fold protein YncE
MIMKRIVFFIILSAAYANAQSLNDVFKESKKAADAKDYPRFLQLTQKLDSMRPMHPSISYNLATAYTLNDKNAKAFEVLKRIAYADNRVDISDDPNFAGFVKTPDYTTLQQLRKSLDVTISGSQKVSVLNEKLLHPEGLAYTNGQGWLAASVRKRKIVVFDQKSGNCTDWLAEKDMLAVFSIKSSKDSKYLWAATAAIPEMEGYDTSLEGKAEVLKIDIATKKIIKRFAVDGSHVFGDLLVSSSGTVYVSDSNIPLIYKIEGESMTEWLDLSREAFNLQGLAIDEKESVLFVADYLKGITAITIKDKKHSWFSFPEGTTPKGIDGLTYYNNTLIAIHNGVTPIRIVQYKLNSAKNAFAGFTVIDNNRSEFNEPVLGTVHEHAFYFFANSPWKAYGRDGTLDESAVSNPELFSYSLKN